MSTDPTAHQLDELEHYQPPRQAEIDAMVAAIASASPGHVLDAIAAYAVAVRADERAKVLQGLREALERLLASEKVAPPVVAGMEWPARCWDCAFTTEDPDAFLGEDEEAQPELLCPVTGTWHRWVPAGLVRYIPADTIAVFRAALADKGSREAGEA